MDIETSFEMKHPWDPYGCLPDAARRPLHPRPQPLPATVSLRGGRRDNDNEHPR